MAEAREYRETLAIENAIQKSSEQRDAWLKRQLKLEDIEEANFSITEEEEVSA